MLVKDHQQRRNRLKEIKKHDYFNGFDWVGLINFKLEEKYRFPEIPLEEYKEEMPYLEYIKVKSINLEKPELSR